MNPFEHMKAKDGEEPRAYTGDETREMLLKHLVGVTRYWATADLQRTWATKEAEIKDRCEGVLFTVLSTLDGSSMAVPAFMVVPDPHPDDEAHHKENGENWFPTVPEDQAAKLTNISGGLHEVLHKYMK